MTPPKTSKAQPPPAKKTGGKKAAAKAVPAKKAAPSPAPVKRASPRPAPPPQAPPADFDRMITLTQFAERVGLNQTTVFGYANREQGDFPKAEAPGGYTEPSGRRWYYPETADEWAANRSGRGRRYDLERGQTKDGRPPWRGPRAAAAKAAPAAKKTAAKKTAAKKKG